MDTKLKKYQKIIQNLLNRYAEIINRRPKPEREVVVVCDIERNHYQLNRIGWDGDRRIWQTIVYVRLRKEKFWIEIDGLEDGIATDLLDAGVPNEDIVLAFHHPTLRPHTEFAIA